MGIYKRDKESAFWWADITVPGRGRVRISTGTADRIEAQKIHDRKRAELWAAPTETERGALLSSWVLQWCAKDERGMPDIQSMGKFMEYYADRDIAVAAQDVAGIDEALRKFVKTPGTYTRYRNRLHAIFEMARAQGAITRTPELLKWTVGKKKAPTYIKDQSRLNDLLQHLAEHQRPMVLFAVYTGLRQSNVLGLTWERVDLERKLVWVDATETKAGKTLSIPLSDGALAVLRGQYGQHPIYVFTYKGRRIYEIKTAFMKACAKAGLGSLTYVANPKNKTGRSQHYEGLRWHDLRHTFASWHIMKGTPPQVLKELGGWSSMQMVENYTHLAPSFVAEFANNIG